MSERATPFYCPYCGEETLTPQEEPRGAWRCDDCRRVFTVKLAGLAVGDLPADLQEVSR